jgi:hypothetical protein
MDGLPPSARLVGIGFYVAICIAGGALLGRWLDGEFDTGALLTMVGLGLGLVMAFYGGYKQLMEVLHAIEHRRTEGNKD